MKEDNNTALYCPLMIKLPLADYAVNLSYVEILDNNYIDMHHQHDSYEICYCLENKLKISVKEDEYKLLSGEFMLLMPGTRHYVKPEHGKTYKYFVMVFDLTTAGEYNEKTRPLATKLHNLSLVEHFVRGSCSLDEINPIINKMERELNRKETGWLFLFRGHCLEFLFYCLRTVIGQIHEEPKEADYLNLAIEISKYIQANFSKRITLTDIANELHISSRHAQRIFKDYFGISFTKALNLNRINQVKGDLVNTNLSINEVAERAGLSSAQPLYRLFREQENMSINEYRIMHKSISHDEEE